MNVPSADDNGGGFTSKRVFATFDEEEEEEALPMEECIKELRAHLKSTITGQKNAVKVTSLLSNLCKASSLPPEAPPPPMPSTNGQSTSPVVKKEKKSSFRLIAIILSAFAADESMPVRASAIRCMRYFLKEVNFIKALEEVGAERLIGRALERDDGPCRPERLQAMRLIRAWLGLRGTMPLSLIMSLSSIATHSNDLFRLTAIDTLREIAMRNPRLIEGANAFRPLMLAIIDSKLEKVSESMIFSLILLLNDPKKRVYVDPLEYIQIISPFTDQRSAETDEAEQSAEFDKLCMASNKAMISLLRTWVGMISLFSNRMAFHSVIDTLRLGGSRMRRLAVLHLLFQLFCIQTPREINDFAGAFEGSKMKVSDKLWENLSLPPQHHPKNLLNVYLAISLRILMDYGLMETLVDLGMSSDDTIAKVSTHLVGELLDIADYLLPASQCARLHALPNLVSLASTFTDDPNHRAKAASMVVSLHKFSQQRQKEGGEMARGEAGKKTPGVSFLKSRQIATELTGGRLDEIARSQLEAQIDEQSFQQMIKASQVLSAKDVGKWDWSVILSILQGPLNNPQRVAECLKTKFVKRLILFFRPSRAMFALLPRSSNNYMYVRALCELFDVLINYAEGIDAIKESQILSEIYEILYLQLPGEAATAMSAPERRSTMMLSPSERKASSVGASSEYSAQMVLQADNVARTMAREYFTLIGRLSCTDAGVELLAEYKILDCLERLTVSKGREDLTRLIVLSLDYSVDGHARNILEQATRSASKLIRYHSVKHLRHLLRQGVDSFHQWGIDMLATSLHDADKEVVQMALSILNEACDDEKNLEALIERRPALDNEVLGREGKQLLSRFLSSSKGFEVLQERNYIEKEAEAWHRELNVSYVLQVEEDLVGMFTSPVFNPYTSTYDGKLRMQRGAIPGIDPDNLTSAVIIPPHFYGELAKTQAGCDILEEKGHFWEFVETIRDEGEYNAQAILHKRAAMWAVGNIGASVNGLGFIRESGIIKDIIALALESEVLSLRGTGLAVMGLFASTSQGRDILASFGWESPRTPDIAIALPRDITAAFKLKFAHTSSSEKMEDVLIDSMKKKEFDPPRSVKINDDGSNATPEEKEKMRKEKEKSGRRRKSEESGDITKSNGSEKEKQVMEDALLQIGAVHSFLSQADARAELTKFSEEYTHVFEKEELFERAHELLGTYHYRLNVKRFVHSLLDRSLPAVQRAYERLAEEEENAS